MDLELSEEQSALQESVHDFLEVECPVSLVRQVVEEGKGADELWGKMVELDWPAVAIGEDEGGLGLGFVDLAVVTEQQGQALSPAPFLGTACHYVSAIRLAGNEDQRRIFLEPVAREGLVGTLALAEPGGKFDLAHVEAEAVARGGGWELHGTKHFVIDGVRADELVVVARVSGTDGHEGLGLFVVPQESVRANPMPNLDASRQYASVELDGACVGPERTLVAPGDDASVVDLILEEATTALTVELVGTCQAIFDIVHDYVRQREQFGVKIGSFQAIKHKLSDMYVALESARATAYFAALCIAEDDERRSLAVSMAKSSVADCQKLLTQHAIQTLGGIGYTWEHDMHIFVKRAKASGMLFGTGAEHRQIIAAKIGLSGPEANSERLTGG